MTALLIVAVEGATVGLGHHRRMSRLGDALRREGVSVDFFALPDSVPADDILPAVEDLHQAALVVDVPDSKWSLGFEVWTREASSRGLHVTTVDRIAVGTNLVLVPSFHLDPRLRQAASRQATPILWGWEHLLVERSGGEAPQVEGLRALVLTGGSDSTGLGTVWPNAIDSALPLGWSVNWVVGPHAAPPILPRRTRLQWRVVRGEVDLQPMMSGSTASLAVYGVTALELLVQGVPSVLYSPYGQRDVEHLGTLEREGLALVELDPMGAVEQLARLTESRDLMRGLESNCGRLGDTRVSTTARALLSACGAHHRIGP